jgi:hypothetical protein
LQQRHARGDGSFGRDQGEQRFWRRHVVDDAAEGGAAGFDRFGA